MSRRNRRGRPVNGILLLDKPIGITSNAALQKMKRLYGAQKAGHTGSLDPLATGLLPICFGEATKVSGFLLDADKSYLATCQLGIRTDSADSDGQVIETRPVDSVSSERVHEVLETFIGDLQQTPPMHSAIKQNGVPLYKLAHQGIEVERKSRKISIFDLQMRRLTDNELEIYVHCSKGTYIRTLADDIGQDLGCGAHITALRRVSVVPFEQYPMLTMEELESIAESGFEALDQRLLATESALSQWPAVKLSPDSAFYLQKGQAVFVPNNDNHGLVRLYESENRFLGIGLVQDDGKVAPKRLMNMAN